VKFAPWEWDNTKLMVWTYLAVLPFLAIAMLMIVVLGVHRKRTVVNVGEGA